VYAGQTVLNGVRTKRYVLSSDLAAVRRASSAIDGQPADYGRVQADIEVWLDGQGRPRQVRELFHGGPAPAGDSLLTVIRFTGYGDPVTIRPPARARRLVSSPSAVPRAFATDPSEVYERLLFGGE